MKAAIYLRRSTDKQEYSMGDQEKAILEYATQHDCDIVRRFEDDAISGTSVNGREGFKCKWQCKIPHKWQLKSSPLGWWVEEMGKKGVATECAVL